MSTKLSVKAINHFRKRDIFPYLALRCYVESFVGRQDRWIREVCTRLVAQDDDPAFLRLYHFKDRSNDVVLHRDIYVPAPSQALAEVALISEASKYKCFSPKPYVYSYLLASKDDKNGVFKPYFEGLKQRHRSIAAACRRSEKAVVHYTDIKRFYPSISFSDASSAWEAACDASQIPDGFLQLGLCILRSHSKVCEIDGTGEGLLTGPAFSHLIANLLLDRLDCDMHEVTGGNYWRYVDDIVFVGTSDQVDLWRSQLQDKLSELSLVLHDGSKDFQVPCDDWLEGEFDFDNSVGIEWVSLIANIKRFLLANPSQATALRRSFEEWGIRIPVVDYSNAVKESSYLERFLDWAQKYEWAIRSVKKLTIERLLVQAGNCREKLYAQLVGLIEEEGPSTPYAEKRITPKLRFLSGRVLYLCNGEELLKLHDALVDRPGLFLIAKTMQAVSTRNFTDLLAMGVNATHAAAQLVRVSQDRRVYVNDDIELSEVVKQSLAVLELNGLHYEFVGPREELLKLAAAEDIQGLMRSNNPFVREVACLHGMDGKRYEGFLDVSFDRDEDLAMDVLNQLQKSS